MKARSKRVESSEQTLVSWRQIKKSCPTDERGTMYSVVSCCLVVLQDLSWCEAETLADVVQLAELVNGGAALLGNRCERLTLLHLVETCLTRCVVATLCLRHAGHCTRSGALVLNILCAGATQTGCLS